MAPALDIFLQAVELAGEARAALLAEACAGDDALRAEVEALLRADARAHTLLDGGAAAAFGHLLGDESAAPALPERIGAYRILDRLGEGGMATVYRAEQTSPRRPVALKVLKPNVASERQLRRFELEASLLARLQHPGIAQVYEAGTADIAGARVAFFAMELVDGVPISRFVRDRALPRARVLELFASVCDAVQHAHQRGVVHRDLKPGNVLVDGAGRARVLDFGVAFVAQDQDLPAVLTRAGEIVGTLGYMAPEQVAGDPLDIDSRADVYALGVMLFELLTGERPLDVSTGSLTTALRAVVEQEPRRLADVADELRGDLDVIVHKAMAKDRERRYATAAELAADVRRHLAREPIAARLPTLGYQLTRFAARNRVLVGGVAATFLALVAGIVTTAWQASRAETARHEVQATADRQQRMLDFLLQRVLSAGDPWSGRSRDVPFVTVLEQAAEDAEDWFAGDPRTLASILAELGDNLRGLGRDARAEELERRALQVAADSFGDDDALTLAVRNQLALSLRGQSRYDEAERNAAAAWRDAAAKLGHEHPLALACLNNLLITRKERGVKEGLDADYEFLVEASERVLGADARETLVRKTNLARWVEQRGDLARAEQLMREAHDGHLRTDGPDHPDTAVAADMLASVLARRDQLDEAERLSRGALVTLRQALGDAHDHVLATSHHLARILAARGRTDEAIPLWREARRVSGEHQGPGHRSTIILGSHLAEALFAAGEYEQARELLAHDQPFLDSGFGDGSPYTVQGRIWLGRVALATGDAEAALPLLRDADARAERVFSAQSELIPAARMALAQALAATGAADQARTVLARELERCRTALGAGHALTAQVADAAAALPAVDRQP